MKLNTKVVENKWNEEEGKWHITTEDQNTKEKIEDWAHILINGTGIPIVIASGNSALDACEIAPANVPEAITVAASDVDNKWMTNPTLNASMTSSDITYSFANTGSCVSVFAPGVDILGACGGGGSVLHLFAPYLLKIFPQISVSFNSIF